MLGEATYSLILVDSFTLQTQKRQPLLPLAFTLLSIRHLDLRIAIIVSLNVPFKAKVNQRGMVDDKLARLDCVLISRSPSDIVKTK